MRVVCTITGVCVDSVPFFWGHAALSMGFTDADIKSTVGGHRPWCLHPRIHAFQG
jgi:hypothetical protein